TWLEKYLHKLACCLLTQTTNEDWPESTVSLILLRGFLRGAIAAPQVLLPGDRPVLVFGAEQATFGELTAELEGERQVEQPATHPARPQPGLGEALEVAHLRPAIVGEQPARLAGDTGEPGGLLSDYGGPEV